jgi:hypothetical protein
MATAGRSKGLSNVLKLPENLSELLAFDPDTLAVTGREGKRREFKLHYFQKDISDYTKTLAAFAMPTLHHLRHQGPTARDCRR